jgi:hypothetical protein
VTLPPPSSRTDTATTAGPEPSGLLLLTGEAVKVLTGLTVISLGEGEGDGDGVGEADGFTAE